MKQKVVHLFLLALLALLGWPVRQAQTVLGRDAFKLLSSYDDDPFVADTVVESMEARRFGTTEDGHPILQGDQVRIQDEPFVYREDPETHEFLAFAANPWPAPLANADGAFTFPDEARFPLHLIERDPSGKPVLDENGLQLWKPRDLRRGMNTAFEAANAAKDATEFWAGRALLWGNNNQLEINTHAFIDFNAFYSPTARMLFFGVVPYRLPGRTEVKVFEMATSWEIAAHEAGHALHDALKPNSVKNNLNYKTWSESFGDQVEMWTSLRDAERVRNLLAETHGDLRQSNSLTRLGEALGGLIGEDVALRDAFHDKQVSDTDEGEHARSEVFTGAAYKIFLKIYDELRPKLGAEAALQTAAQIMGIFLTRANDYLPEDQMTFEEVGQAYLKVDKEYFSYRYHTTLVEEFTRRKIFDADSVRAWLAHEAALPQLYLLPHWPDQHIERVLQANLDKLGIGPAFGLKLQSVTHLNQFRGQPRPALAPAQTIVRVQLTQGRGEDATPLDNYGILVFRTSGRLADYQTPLPAGEQASLAPDVFAQTRALALVGQAHQFRLAEHGVPLALVRKPNGQLTVEARVLRGTGLNSYMEVFTLDNPRGERHEIVIPPVPPNKRIRITDDLLK